MRYQDYKKVHADDNDVYDDYNDYYDNRDDDIDDNNGYYDYNDDDDDWDDYNDDFDDNDLVRRRSGNAIWCNCNSSKVSSRNKSVSRM